MVMTEALGTVILLRKIKQLSENPTDHKIFIRKTVKQTLQNFNTVKLKVKKKGKQNPACNFSKLSLSEKIRK